MPGGFKGGFLFIGPWFLPPWAELADPSPEFVEKRGARAGDLSPWLDPRPPDLGVLAGKAEILGRSPPPLPFGTRVLDCSLASGSLLCWKRIVGVLFRTIFIESSFIAHCKHFYFIRIVVDIQSFEAANCIVDSAFGIVVSCLRSGVICGGGGVSSEEGATRWTGFSGVISTYVSNRVRQ